MVTRVVNLLGVPTVAEDDLKPADEDNPRGYFESRSLTSFNRRLLLEVGGAPYSLAPRFPDGWMAAPSLDPLREEARELMQTLHPTTPWVWRTRAQASRCPSGSMSPASIRSWCSFTATRSRSPTRWCAATTLRSL